MIMGEFGSLKQLLLFAMDKYHSVFLSDVAGLLIIRLLIFRTVNGQKCTIFSVFFFNTDKIGWSGLRRKHRLCLSVAFRVHIFVPASFPPGL